MRREGGLRIGVTVVPGILCIISYHKREGRRAGGFVSLVGAVQAVHDGQAGWLAGQTQEAGEIDVKHLTPQI